MAAIERIAAQRKAVSHEMGVAADWTVSYEDITDGGNQIDELPGWFVERFCELVGVPAERLPVYDRKDRKIAFAGAA